MVYPDRLAKDLRRFSRAFGATIAGVTSTIAANTTDRTIRELTLEAKIQLIPTMYSVVAVVDPRQAFIEAWVVCVQTRLLLTRGRGKEIFADQQHLIVDAIERMEQLLREIGVEHFGEELIEKAAPLVEKHAAENPISERFDVATGGAEERAWWGGAVSTVMSVPMAPFRGLSGVGDAPSAINEFSLTASHFTDVVRQLPTLARWQLELLLFEIDSLQSVVEARQGLDRASRGIESFSKTAETLPADIRRELEATIEAAEKSQEGFRSTLQEARTTAETVKATVKDADEVSKSIQEAGLKLTETAEAWEAALKTASEGLLIYERIASPEGEEVVVEEEGPSDIENITQLAVEFRKAAVELRALLEDLEAGKLDNALDEAGKAADTSVERVVDRTERLVHRITICAVIVIAAALVAMVLYRVISKKLG